MDSGICGVNFYFSGYFTPGCFPRNEWSLEIWLRKGILDDDIISVPISPCTKMRLHINFSLRESWLTKNYLIWAGKPTGYHSVYHRHLLVIAIVIPSISLSYPYYLGSSLEVSFTRFNPTRKALVSTSASLPSPPARNNFHQDVNCARVCAPSATQYSSKATNAEYRNMDYLFGTFLDIDKFWHMIGTITRRDQIRWG